MAGLETALGNLGRGAGGALGAGAGGGMLHVLGEALGAPRRALWNALGGPDTGEELVSNLGLADRRSALARALGLGAEVLLDPLTYVGALPGLVGGARLGAAGGAALGRTADEVEALKLALQPAAEELATTGALRGTLDDALRTELGRREAQLGTQAPMVPFSSPGPVMTRSDMANVPMDLSHLITMAQEPRNIHLRYTPEVENAIPSWLSQGSVPGHLTRTGMESLTPRAVTPLTGQEEELASMLDTLGLGGRGPEGQVMIHGPGRPGNIPYAEVRGGRVALPENLPPVNPLRYAGEEPLPLPSYAQLQPGSREMELLQRLTPGLGSPHPVDLPLDQAAGLVGQAHRGALEEATQLRQQLEEMGPLRRLLWQMVGPRMPRQWPDLPAVSELNEYWNPVSMRRGGV